MTAAKPLRIGILGAAKIARQFVEGVAPSPLVKVVAVASREAAKAAAFAAEFAIPRALGSYEALLADPAIDAVYNPLPNSLHAEWSIKAAAAGKHVLCEKPLAVSDAEARAMFDAARRHGVHLVEAYPYLAQPQTLKTRELLRSGAIGKPQLIRASFGVPFSDPTNIRLMPDLAGGSLMDAGSYCVSFVRVMAGERPSRVQAMARWGDTGVDRTLLASIEFPSGLVAQVASSFTTAYHRQGQIAGDNGIIDTWFLNHPPLGGPPVLQLRTGATVAATLETITVEGGNGFRYEAESFARLVGGDPAGWNGATAEESIDIAATLAALLASARSGTPVAVPG